MHQTQSLRGFLIAASASIGTIGLAPLAGAATLASYDFEAGLASTDTNPFSVASPITYDADSILVDRIGSVGNPGAALHYATRESALGDAKLHDGLVTMTLAPAPGFAMNLYYFETDLAAVNLSAPSFTAQLFVFSSLDNYASPIHFNVAADPTPSASSSDHGPYSHAESEAMLQNQVLYSNVTTPVEFHFYFLGTSVQYALLDNVRISGTMAVAPEPMGLVGLCAMAMVSARRRTRS